jgi:hypothetical protein
MCSLVLSVQSTYLLKPLEDVAEENVHNIVCGIIVFQCTFDVVEINHNFVLAKCDVNIQCSIFTITLFGDVLPLWNQPR